MNRTIRRLLAFMLLFALMLCAHCATADERVRMTAYVLDEMHYSIQSDWTTIEGETEPCRFHSDDAAGSTGTGSVLASLESDDFSGFDAEGMRASFINGLQAGADAEIACETVSVSGYDSFVVSIIGSYYGIGEASSATLIIPADGCSYWLTYFSGADSAGIDWLYAITDIYIGDDPSGAYNTGGSLAVIKNGDRSESVRNIQRRLIELGYLAGSADGVFGAKTQSAIESLQEEAGLPGTGECDLVTYEVLASVNAPAAPKATAKPTEKPSDDDKGSSAKYIGNRNTGKFHYAWCSSVDRMNEKNKVPISSRDAAISKGYTPCKRCDP